MDVGDIGQVGSCVFFESMEGLCIAPFGVRAKTTQFCAAVTDAKTGRTECFSILCAFIGTVCLVLYSIILNQEKIK